MIGRRPNRCVGVAVVVLGLAVLACNMAAGRTGSLPTVSIISPESGTFVSADEPLRVEVSADDPEGPGIVHVELQMDGQTVDTFAVDDPQAGLGASLTCTPTEEGTQTLTVVAYRQDGTASLPVTISLNVEAASLETTAEIEPDELEEPAEPDEPDEPRGPLPSPSPTADETVQARANLSTNIRERPGAGCPIIGVVPRDAVIVLLGRTSSSTDYWYQTDYLGEGELGWVYHDALSLLGDDSDLPREREQNCPYCGDATCNATLGETCASCATDCGACATSAPPIQPGACTAGPGNCCGDGVCQTDESPDWCGDCAPAAPALWCGDGTCSASIGENCASCQADCGECGPECGDGICEGNEGCRSCPTDCGGCCGNGTCDSSFGEDCATCPADCGGCCGDGTCDGSLGEDCNSCPADCPICFLEPVCGDGYCDGLLGESCCNCVADCPITSNECFACGRP